MTENRKNHPNTIESSLGVAQTGLRWHILAAVGLFGVASGCGYVPNPNAADSNDERMSARDSQTLRETLPPQKRLQLMSWE